MKGKGVGFMIHRGWAKFRLASDWDGAGRGIMVRFVFAIGFHRAVFNCYFLPLSRCCRRHHLVATPDSALAIRVTTCNPSMLTSSSWSERPILS